MCGTGRREDERDLQARESTINAAVREIRRRDHHEEQSVLRWRVEVGGVKLASYLLGDKGSFRVGDHGEELVRIVFHRLVQHRDARVDAVVDVESRRVLNRNVGEGVRDDGALQLVRDVRRVWVTASADADGGSCELHLRVVHRGVDRMPEDEDCRQRGGSGAGEYHGG